MSAPEGSFHVWDCERLLKVRCPWSWDALGETPDADVRHCPSCDRDVYLCRKPADFVAHGERGRCVAIPDGLSPGLGLGEPSPKEVLRAKASADRGAAWWEEVIGRRPSLSPEQMESVRAARKSLEGYNSLYSEEHLALLRLAVRSGGLRCPKCGLELAEDHFGALMLLGTRRCEHCQEPIELDLSSA